MPPRLRTGIPALFKFRPVSFSHIVIEPGSQPLLTADPWSYLRAHLNEAMSGYRTRHRKNCERALYYTRLAEGFYNALSAAHARTRGVLAYYGMLNLVKSYLAVRDVSLEVKWEHHGLSVPLDSEDVITVASPVTDPDGVRIFHELAALLGSPASGRHDLKFLEACGHIPELHGILFNLDLLPAGQTLLPIEIEFLVNERRDRLFAEVRYDKGHETRLPVKKKFLRRERRKYLKEGVRDDERIVHQTKELRPISNSSWPRVYKNMLERFQKFDIASLLTRSGYRYYCDLEPGSYHHLCYAFMVMFYIGSITRYRPTVADEAFGGRSRPVATEALALIPRQFLYQMASLITGKLCVVPYADL